MAISGERISSRSQTIRCKIEGDRFTRWSGKGEVGGWVGEEGVQQNKEIGFKV